jgi:hypothetical protein
VVQAVHYLGTVKTDISEIDWGEGYDEWGTISYYPGINLMSQKDYVSPFRMVRREG